MAIYRNVSLTFWTDMKVTDDFTPEDRYFFLYLLTNTHTNLCGCYEIGLKQMARETGYNEETVKRLIERMHDNHHVIDYDENTKEVLVWNWSKYNWSRSRDFVNGVLNSIESIKSSDLKDKVRCIFDCFMNKKGDGLQTVYRDSTDGGETSVSVSVTDTVTVTDKYSEFRKEIIDYLNTVLNTKYRYTSKGTNRHINARLEEGFTVDDFKTVIDKKSKAWMNNPKMATYLRPETLFGSKFESYLNETEVTEKKPQNIFDEWANA